MTKNHKKDTLVSLFEKTKQSTERTFGNDDSYEEKSDKNLLDIDESESQGENGCKIKSGHTSKVFRGIDYDIVEDDISEDDQVSQLSIQSHETRNAHIPPKLENMAGNQKCGQYKMHDLENNMQK